MPIVHLYYGSRFLERYSSMPDSPSYSKVENARSFLHMLCNEIVPASLHVQRLETDPVDAEIGELAPGSIVFFAHYVDSPFRRDIYLDIEAMAYPRRDDMDGRAEVIKAALHRFIPDSIIISVWAKAVTAGWASDNHDPDFEGSMTMEAAVDRLVEQGADLVD